MTILLQRDRRRSRYLFDWSARWTIERGTLDAVTGQAATFARASTAGAIGSSGRVQRVAHSQPRYDWVDLDGDGVRETPSLLLESSQTNGLTYSDDLTNSAWGKADATATYASVGPYGQANAASALLEAATNAAHYVLRAVPGYSANTVQSYQCKVKAINGRTRGRFVMQSNSGVDQMGVSFDLATGTVVDQLRGAGANTASRIRALADGWYLVEVSGTTHATATAANIVFATEDATGAVSFVGDVTKGLLVADMQVETDRGNPTSAMPTGASTVTRAAESLAFAFAAPPQPLTVYVKYRFRPATSSTVSDVFMIGNAGSTGALMIFRAENLTTIGRLLHTNGAVLVESNSGSAAAPALGALVEVRALLNPDGSVQLGMATAGGAETLYGASGTPSPLAAAWGAPTSLYLGCSPNANGCTPVIAARVAVGVQSLAYMREG